MKISFDFDGTLDNEFDGSVNNQKLEIQKLAKKYITDGHDVCILTKRFDEYHPHHGKQNEHVEVYDIARSIGIKKVIFTNREPKHDFILNLNIDMHFENADYEVKLINEHTSCKVVPVEDPYWRDLVY